jgi:hypothetical protein
MNLNIYNKGTILAPLKSGTRYLDEVFGEDCESIWIDHMQVYSIPSTITTIIVRPPLEHLISALHTEVLGTYNHTEVEYGTENIIVNVLDQFTYDETKWKRQNTHWFYEIYAVFYLFWRRNREHVEVIYLKDLSSHLESIGILHPEYNKKDYDFTENSDKFYCSKEELVSLIKTNYPKQWKNLMQQIEICDKFYDCLINKEIPTKVSKKFI